MVGGQFGGQIPVRKFKGAQSYPSPAPTPVTGSGPLSAASIWVAREITVFLNSPPALARPMTPRAEAYDLGCDEALELVGRGRAYRSRPTAGLLGRI